MAERVTEVFVARQIADTITTPGWQHVLDLLEKRCVLSEQRLLRCNGSREQEVVDLHRRARSAREILDGLHSDLEIILSMLIQEGELQPNLDSNKPQESW